MKLKPVESNVSNFTIIPKLDSLSIVSKNGQSKLVIKWHKFILETNDIMPQSDLELTQELMNNIFPDGFKRYNPITGEQIQNLPKITISEMMVFVYSVFKNLIIEDLTTNIDPDVPEDDLIVEE